MKKSTQITTQNNSIINNNIIINYLHDIINKIKNNSISPELYKNILYILLKYEKKINIDNYLEENVFSNDMFNYTLGYYINMCYLDKSLHLDLKSQGDIRDKS